jgi:hypothetical protein
VPGAEGRPPDVSLPRTETPRRMCAKALSRADLPTPLFPSMPTVSPLPGTPPFVDTVSRLALRATTGTVEPREPLLQGALTLFSVARSALLRTMKGRPPEFLATTRTLPEALQELRPPSGDTWKRVSILAARTVHRCATRAPSAQGRAAGKDRVMPGPPPPGPPGPSPPARDIPKEAPLIIEAAAHPHVVVAAGEVRQSEKLGFLKSRQTLRSGGAPFPSRARGGGAVRRGSLAAGPRRVELALQSPARL